MQTINGNIIRDILSKQNRIYLSGNLNRNQPFEHIKTSDLEIGISNYQDFTSDMPHEHIWNNEYNIILQGEIKVYIFNEHMEYIFHKDDLFLIEPNMQYIVKANKDTQVLFIKSPGGNDKKLLPITPAIEQWMQTWENKMNY